MDRRCPKGHLFRPGHPCPRCQAEAYGRELVAQWTALRDEQLRRKAQRTADGAMAQIRATPMRAVGGGC
jgi:hypothetical protein